MATTGGAFEQFKDSSVADLHERLSASGKNLLDSKLSQRTLRRPGSVLQQRRQIARLLTYLRGLNG
jgi:ribosomal protein L29